MLFFKKIKELGFKINYFYNKLGIINQRSKNITSHVIISFLYKGGSILSTFLIVPLTIKFLEIDDYGIWLTLSSFISWFSFFDVGLGNGLRNKFVEAKAGGNFNLAKAYVSSAYFTIGLISIMLILIFLALNFFIDWSHLFNTNLSKQKELSILMPIVFSFFCLQLIVKLITTIYTADEQHSTQGKVTFYSSFLSLFGIYLMTNFAESSLLLFGIIISAIPFLLLLFLNFYAFSDTYKVYKPSFRLWNKKYLKDIFGLGFTFFIIQIAGIILYSTDNFIISYIFSPSSVVPYNIAYKYFSISTMVMSLIATPFWSSITNAYHTMDYVWISSGMKSLFKITFLVLILNIILYFLSSAAYVIWTDDMVKVDSSLSILMCIFYLLSLFVTPFTIFLNGIGKIKLQAYQSVVVALLNIPFAFLLAE